MIRAIAVGGLALVGGCSSILGSEDDTLQAGEYSVLMRVHPSDTPEPFAFVGSLRLTFATEDSVAGSWDVGGFDPAVRDGAWDGDAFQLAAGVRTTPWVANLRIARDGRSCRGMLTFPGLDLDAAPSLECRIAAGPPPADFPVITTVAFLPVQGTYRVGCTIPFTIATRDQYGQLLVPRSIVFSSSNAGIARVSGSWIECYSPGQATLTATAGGKSGTALITVLNPFAPLPVVATPGASVRH